ncbi:MAG: aspartate ammonia-lyase [Firmicutes bacterium]|nr:aspartate ammonia-lyase [Bacillota bacterium]
MHHIPNRAYRVEKDLLGEKQVPAEAYYGIHTARAIENFAVSAKPVNPYMIQAMAVVKKAAAMTHHKLGQLPPEIADAIIAACDEILAGSLEDQFVVDAFQGGAGTSTNMNVNEVVANRAIEMLGGQKGNYEVVHPLHHVNYCQSTNDVYPTALRIAAINLLRPLSDAFAALQEALQEKENEFADVIKLGRTQLMDALPMMAGQTFGAYAKAIARDRWRLYKVEERLRQVNIGGTAIGTGINAPPEYIFTMTDVLQELTGLGIARSEFPMDITQNMDVFVEVSGLLKAAAVNVMKIANDLRLLASGPAGGVGELILPPVQAGSSIMPGKVNPVIPEMVNQVAMRVIANDASITHAAMSGQLELNAFGPLITEALLESLEMMTKAIALFEHQCVREIGINEKQCKQYVDRSSALATALVYHIGYDRASEIAKKAQKEQKTIRQVLMDEEIMTEEKIEQILNPYQVTKPGIPGGD